MRNKRLERFKVTQLVSAAPSASARRNEESCAAILSQKEDGVASGDGKYFVAAFHGATTFYWVRRQRGWMLNYAEREDPSRRLACALKTRRPGKMLSHPDAHHEFR